MLIYALCAIPIFTAQLLGTYSIWFPVFIIGFGAAAHQAWSANIYTTVSDMFPKRAVASITGIAGMAGGVGGIVISKSAGYLFDYYKSLTLLKKDILFCSVFAVAYIVAWIIMQLSCSKNEKNRSLIRRTQASLAVTCCKMPSSEISELLSWKIH